MAGGPGPASWNPLVAAWLRQGATKVLGLRGIFVAEPLLGSVIATYRVSRRLVRCGSGLYCSAAMPEPAIPPTDRMSMLRRKPQRISITISQSTYDRLISRSDQEGRSVSNLAAYLLENGLVQPDVPPTTVVEQDLGRLNGFVKLQTQLPSSTVDGHRLHH